jgi:hypothetical protein
MMMRASVGVGLLALLLCALSPPARALDLSWVPTGDGPLPSSENYRGKLRKLCDLIIGSESAAKKMTASEKVSTPLPLPSPPASTGHRSQA